MLTVGEVVGLLVGADVEEGPSLGAGTGSLGLCSIRSVPVVKQLRTSSSLSSDVK